LESFQDNFSLVADLLRFRDSAGPVRAALDALRARARARVDRGAFGDPVEFKSGVHARELVRVPVLDTGGVGIKS
jgi:hypothetical protein